MVETSNSQSSEGSAGQEDEAVLAEQLKQQKERE
jgi:hypothetical protein